MKAGENRDRKITFGNELIISWLAPLSLFLCLFASSYRYLSTWFMIDDMSLIHAAATKSAFDMLFDRETYLTFHRLYYTPLFPLPFKLDWAIFKLDPTGYHLHNLIAVFLTSLVGYRVLRLYLPSLNAWCGTFLFAISYPNITNIGWITRKHYIWGTFLVLLSFYLFKRAEKIKSYARYAVSLILFLAALLMKEAFAPMPAAVLLLSSGNLKERVGKSLPFFLVLGVYFLLRFYFLGGLGGYIFVQTTKLDVLSLLSHSYKNISFAISAVWGIKWLFLIVISLLVINPKKSWIFITLFFVWLSPFMLIRMPDNDFGVFYFPSKFILPVFVVSAMTAFSLAGDKPYKKYVGYGLLIVLAVLQILNLYGAENYIKKTSAHYKNVSTEMRERLKTGNVFMVDRDFPYFYNFYYELLRLLKDDSLKGGLATTNSYEIPHVGSYLKNSRFVYLNDAWVDSYREPLAKPSAVSDDSLPPDVRVRFKPPFVEGEITDRSNAEFIIANLNMFSGSNVICHSFNVPPFVGVRAGLKRSEAVYVYRKTGNVFSRPYIIKLPD